MSGNIGANPPVKPGISVIGAASIRRWCLHQETLYTAHSSECNHWQKVVSAETIISWEYYRNNLSSWFMAPPWYTALTNKQPSILCPVNAYHRYNSEKISANIFPDRCRNPIIKFVHCNFSKSVVHCWVECLQCIRCKLISGMGYHLLQRFKGGTTSEFIQPFFFGSHHFTTLCVYCFISQYLRTGEIISDADSVLTTLIRIQLSYRNLFTALHNDLLRFCFCNKSYYLWHIHYRFRSNLSLQVPPGLEYFLLLITVTMQNAPVVSYQTIWVFYLFT